MFTNHLSSSQWDVTLMPVNQPERPAPTETLVSGLLKASGQSVSGAQDLVGCAFARRTVRFGSARLKL